MKVHSSGNFGHDGGRFCVVVVSGKTCGSSRISFAAKDEKSHIGVHNKYLVPMYFGDIRAMIENIPSSFTFQVSRVL